MGKKIDKNHSGKYNNISEKFEKSSSKNNSSKLNNTKLNNNPNLKNNSKKLLKIRVVVILILLLAAGIFFYFNLKSNLSSNMSKNSNADSTESKNLEDSFNIIQTDNQPINVDFSNISKENAISESNFYGHKSEAAIANKISIDEAKKKILQKFNFSSEDTVMLWPEVIPKESWIWEQNEALGPVGKLQSNGWLFWIDRQFGSPYPHATYYAVVYDDGFVDVFLGSYTPKVGEDDWFSKNTKAIKLQ